MENPVVPTVWMTASQPIPNSKEEARGGNMAGHREGTKSRVADEAAVQERSLCVWKLASGLSACLIFSLHGTRGNDACFPEQAVRGRR